jgi:hypothetical protein
VNPKNLRISFAAILVHFMIAPASLTLNRVKTWLGMGRWRTARRVALTWFRCWMAA